MFYHGSSKDESRFAKATLKTLLLRRELLSTKHPQHYQPKTTHTQNRTTNGNGDGAEAVDEGLGGEQRIQQRSNKGRKGRRRGKTTAAE